MRLHRDISRFRDAVRFTAQQMNLPPEYVEKDYWVTYALHVLFNHEIGSEMVFKGGTALSKCYKMIDRFSEDIDLVVLRREGETDGKLKSKLKAVSGTIETILPQIELQGITRKRGMNRKTAHVYHKEFKGDYGQVRDVIVLESSWLGHYEPYTQKMLNSFVGEMMLSNGQTAMAKDNGLMPFEVRVLEPIRTLCEKNMSLVRFSYGEDPMRDLKKKIRHIYDLHQLLIQEEFALFFHSPAFDKMLLKVADDDVTSFKNNNQWLNYHPSEALSFKDLETVWSGLRQVYIGDFKNLVYGNFPEEAAVFNTLKIVQERLKKIYWTIKIDSRWRSQ